MSRVLSGSKRILNDTVVNIHSTCQSYKTLVLKGVNVLQKIQAKSVKAEPDLESLGTIIKEMEELVDRKLRAYAEQLSSLYELNKSSPTVVPFLTWTYEDFRDAGMDVYESYKIETDIKVKIAHSVFKCVTPEQLDFCLIGWTHFVYTMDETKFEAMIHECCLK